jgi:hypothetical protein
MLENLIYTVPACALIEFRTVAEAVALTFPSRAPS